MPLDDQGKIFLPRRTCHWRIHEQSNRHRVTLTCWDDKEELVGDTRNYIHNRATCTEYEEDEYFDKTAEGVWTDEDTDIENTDAEDDTDDDNYSVLGHEDYYEDSNEASDAMQTSNNSTVHLDLAAVEVGEDDASAQACYCDELLQYTYMVSGAQSALEEMMSLRSYGWVMAHSDPLIFLLRWSDDSQTVFHGDILQVTMSGFRRLPRYFIDKAESLCDDMMFGWKPAIGLSNVKDDMTNMSCGFSFTKPVQRAAVASIEMALGIAKQSIHT
ncbi:telomere-associated helicase [Fusarium pseudocircinatum]|uniref:Telomere-associated helicase n=1 Tax=Fusarium pseudocircinatum TaxID=56676 RepID=A0A8H5KQD1_9HYPO|nr:telomere-associated helicase [Fusarium pseudocircinatum]